MEELLNEGEVDDAAPGSPRLQAIMDLLKFLAQSEAKRAQPAPEVPAPVEAAPGEEDLDPESLEALKSLAR